MKYILFLLRNDVLKVDGLSYIKFLLTFIYREDLWFFFARNSTIFIYFFIPLYFYK